MSNTKKTIEFIEPQDISLAGPAFAERMDRLSRKVGITDRHRFASGWAQRKQALFERVFEAQVGIDNQLPFLFVQQATRTGRAVCKIEATGVNYRGHSGSWVGTGFLVAPGLILTNNHVLNSKDVADNAVAIFDFQDTASGGQSQTQSFQFDPDDLFITSAAIGGLDYAFVSVLDKPEETYGFVEMFRGAFATGFMKRANIIQHPGGKPKTVVLQDNRLLPDDHPLFLHYTTDTEGGSSGSPVFDNNWQLKALHHASRKNAEEARPAESHGPAPKRINEGVKLSSIAADLELKLSSPAEQKSAQRVLAHIRGDDSNTGYFGVRGRQAATARTNHLETLVTTYFGKEQDIDIAFWNVEWFNRQYRERMYDVAGVIADKNIDIWAFSETSPEATEALVDHLDREFGLQFEWAASEPEASSGKQTTTVMWNRETIRGAHEEWPDDIKDNLNARSDDEDALDLEAVDGKIFNRYPGLFHFSTAGQAALTNVSFDFYLVPLHLKAMADGSKRRRMASEILAKAVSVMVERGYDKDWVIGGDVNADLASGDLDPLSAGGFTAVSARDEADGAFTYLSRRYRSLIDHIFLSPNMVNFGDQDDFFILAADKANSSFAEDISDHRPVVVRLSLTQDATASEANELTDLVGRYRDQPAELLRRIADAFDHHAQADQ